jgi:hypothetical protein
VDSRAIFVEAVRTAQQLPAWVREHAEEVRGLSESRFDETYLQFLDEQIGLADQGLGLSSRGPQFLENLKRRRANLAPFCGVSLLYGWYRRDKTDVTVRVQPETKAVVHWEAD